MSRYESNFDKTLDPGNNVILSFLSRSYHESLKNAEAFSLIQLNIKEQEEDSIDLSAPLMFYSRPKGAYQGDDTKKLLLDFYLINTDKRRTGITPYVFNNNFNFDTYVDYALDVPMYFIKRNNKYIDAAGCSFRDFIVGKLPNSGVSFKSPMFFSVGQLFLSSKFPSACAQNCSRHVSRSDVSRKSRSTK